MTSAFALRLPRALRGRTSGAKQSHAASHHPLSPPSALPTSLLAAQEPGLEIDVRSATPREITELSMDLYLAGHLDYEESQILGFQSDLHPNYAFTLAPLTEERADPDRPRDFLRIWEKRLAFESRQCAHNRALIQRTSAIVQALRSLAGND